MSVCKVIELQLSQKRLACWFLRQNYAHYFNVVYQCRTTRSERPVCVDRHTRVHLLLPTVALHAPGESTAHVTRNTSLRHG